MDIESLSDAAKQRKATRIVARHECAQLRDSGSARVRDELCSERRPDAAPLIGVCNREGDFRRAPVANEPRAYTSTPASSGGVTY